MHLPQQHLVLASARLEAGLKEPLVCCGRSRVPGGSLPASQPHLPGCGITPNLGEGGAEKH